MSQVLPDGSVIPSFMDVSDGNDNVNHGWNAMFQNYALRVGYLTAIHYPGDKNYPATRRILYDAIVPQLSPTGAEAMVPYYNCKPATLFGSAADSEHHTFRCPKSYTGKFDDNFLKQTTKVLLLCANGRNNAAYIIAADDNANTAPHKKEDGHNWSWVFNGMNWLVDKEGQLTLTFNGATVDPDGKDLPVNPEVAGSFLKFDKDGSITVDDAMGESVTIDKKNKKIIINSREMVQNATEKGWTVEVAKDVNIHANGNIILNGDGKTYIGKEGSTEPLVRGNQLVAALSELVSIFTSQPAIGALGQVPVTINPVLAAALVQWQAKYGNPSAPILSKAKFTE